MNRKYLLKALRVLGIGIIFVSVLVIPESAPWYYEFVAAWVGWILFFAPQWSKLKKELGF